MEGSEQRQGAPRVLIVEDRALNLKLLKDILEFHGYATTVTGSGAAAIDLARQYRPDLILLDIQLPDIPGTEAARRLKADEETKSIPIIAVTAFAMPGDRTMILDSGCDDYVSKPFNIRDLLALVGRYTSKTGGDDRPGII
jgi:two-component system, cell cycle response regulator DivK